MGSLVAGVRVASSLIASCTVFARRDAPPLGSHSSVVRSLEDSLGERTVKGHVGSIVTKLGARDRAAAIVLAFDAGLVVPGQVS